MWCEKESFLSKKKPRYHYISLGLSIALFVSLRSSKGYLVFFIILEKWKTSDFSYLIVRPNWLKREEIIL